MKFMRITAGCSLLEHRRNEDILEEMKIDPIVQYINQYRLQWKGHVERMAETNSVIYPKMMSTFGNT